MFSTFSRLRFPVQIVVAVVMVAAIGGVGYLVLNLGSKAAQKIASSNVPVVSKMAGLVSDRPINICVNTWGGFAGGQWYNGGFQASKESRFYKEQGILVNFIKQDDFAVSRAAWRSGDCDLLWATVDSFVSEADGLSEFSPKFGFQIDWSRGGDAMPVVRDIKSINELRGRTLGVAFGTPSHSLLLWMLNNSGMKPQDVQIKEFGGEPEVVSAFKAKSLDAGIVWSPDDADCVDAVPGAHVLISTKQATDIIADTLLYKESYAKENHEKLEKLYRGWMLGNAKVSTDSTAFEEAVKITAKGYGQSEDFMRMAIKNVRLTTHGDNLNFFGLNPGYAGMKAEDLYTKTGMLYQQFRTDKGQFLEKFPTYRNVADTSILVAVSDLNQDSLQVAEAGTKFAKPTQEVLNASATTTKPITVNFELNSAVLDDRNQSLIDRNLADVAKQFRDSYIRIEGNTDSTGDPRRNVALSQERAQSVATYLARTYKFDPVRFVIRGNGSKSPVCDEQNPGSMSLDDCRATNRRTEFQVLGVSR